MKCKICGEEFTPARNHPGYINVCLDQDCRLIAHEPHIDIFIRTKVVRTKVAGAEHLM